MPKWFIAVVSAIFAGVVGLTLGALSYQASVQESIDIEIRTLTNNLELQFAEDRLELQKQIQKLQTAEKPVAQDNPDTIAKLQNDLKIRDEQITKLNNDQTEAAIAYAANLENFQQAVATLQYDLKESNQQIIILTNNMDRQDLSALDPQTILNNNTFKVIGFLDPQQFKEMGLVKLNQTEIFSLDNWVDLVIRNLVATSQNMVENFQISNLIGAEIIAEDGQSLGIIGRDRFNPLSILNPVGVHGSQVGDSSIFNPFGKYGGQISPLSPFNSRTETPPKIMKNGVLLIYLTTNGLISPRLDPYFLIAWLQSF